MKPGKWILNAPMIYGAICLFLLVGAYDSSARVGELDKVGSVYVDYDEGGEKLTTPAQWDRSQRTQAGMFLIMAVALWIFIAHQEEKARREALDVKKRDDETIRLLREKLRHMGGTYEV